MFYSYVVLCKADLQEIICKGEAILKKHLKKEGALYNHFVGNS